MIQMKKDDKKMSTSCFHNNHHNCNTKPCECLCHRPLPRLSKDQYWINVLKGIALRGSCPRRQTGAIIVDSNNLILASGYNGPPRALPNCNETPCEGINDAPGQTDRCLAIHAEQNAILQLGDRAARAEIMYATNLPCFNCAKFILQSGIKKVIYVEDYADKRGVNLLRKYGVIVEKGEYKND